MLTENLLIALAFSLALFQALMVFRNLRLFGPPKGGAETDFESSPISVLVPARNEEKNLAKLFKSLEHQEACRFEVLILDDNSEDATLALAQAQSAKDPRFKVLSAPELPPGWAGKQHACHLLSKAAVYEHWLFVDADVTFTDPQALARISQHLEESPSAMLSAIPRQQTQSWAERSIIPLIHLVLLGFLPFWEMRRNTLPALGAACGQMVAVKARCYRKVGGHGAVRHRLHDATALAAHFRIQGYLTDLFDATSIASCRMYQSPQDVFSGFAKNATEGMAQPRLLPLWTFLLLGANVLPLVMWLLKPSSIAAALALACNLWVYLSLMKRYRQDLSGALTRPAGVLLFIAIQWVALIGKWLGWKATWKGRSYQRLHQ